MTIYNRYRDWVDPENKARIKNANDALHDLADDDSFVDVKIKEDNYKGYIQNKNFNSHLIPTHKIKILNTKIYRSPSKKKKVGELTFGSKIKVVSKKLKFLRFEKGYE